MIPDSTHRIVLTKEISDALRLSPGQPLEVSPGAGAVFLTPVPTSAGKAVKKGEIKVFSGKTPRINMEEAIAEGRKYVRL